MILETDRLILRQWELTDAEDLYEHAKDPDVGPAAGWPAHKDVQESKRIIENVLRIDETYAVCLKEDNKAIGSISLKFGDKTDLTDKEDECEMGFWLGKKFWGKGIMPEAARELMRHAFEDLDIKKLWCAYYDGNEKSKRAQEKLGFKYQWTTEDVDVPLLHETRKGHVNCITRKEWEETVL